jgi:hypothetical protein
LREAERLDPARTDASDALVKIWRDQAQAAASVGDSATALALLIGARKLRSRISECSGRTATAIAAQIIAVDAPSDGWNLLNATLLSNAEGTEDQVEDVVGGGGAGDFVEGAQGSVEVEQEHLVGDLGTNGVGSAV